MKYRILVRNGDEWRNLYPPRKGEEPPTFTKEEARKRLKHHKKYFKEEEKIVPVSEARKYPVPKRY